MIEESPPSFVFRCDSCGRTERSASREAPPPGFATLLAQAHAGVFTSTHACATACLIRAAMGVAGRPRP